MLGKRDEWCVVQFRASRVSQTFSPFLVMSVNL